MAHIIKGDSLDSVYRKAIDLLLTDPDFVDTPRNGKMNELMSTSLVITRPRSRLLTLPSRKLSLKYLAGETAFYLSTSQSLEFIAHYAPFWRKISDDGMTVNSAYGKRLFSEFAPSAITQFQYVIEQLTASKASRKAVMMIYKEKDTNLRTKDNACTMYLQFFIRDDKLFAEANMRSNDIWLGTPYDVFFFTLLQDMVLYEIRKVYPEVDMGEYTHHAGSLHLYEKYTEKAYGILRDEDDMFGSPEFEWNRDVEMDLAHFLLSESAYRLNGTPMNEGEYASSLLRFLCSCLNGEA